MLHQVKVSLAAVGWVLAVALMVDGTVDHAATVQRWAQLVALGAFVMTLAALVAHWHQQTRRAGAELHERTRELLLETIHAERVHTEGLVVAVACEFAQAELPRIDALRRV